VVQNPDKLKAV